MRPTLPGFTRFFTLSERYDGSGHRQPAKTSVGLSKMLPVVVSSGISPPPSGGSGTSGTVGGPISSGEPRSWEGWSWDGWGATVLGVAVTVAVGQPVAPGAGIRVTAPPVAPVTPGVTVTVGVVQSPADLSGAGLRPSPPGDALPSLGEALGETLAEALGEALTEGLGEVLVPLDGVLAPLDGVPDTLSCGRGAVLPCGAGVVPGRVGSTWTGGGTTWSWWGPR
jgi:hypothetical protein